VNYILIGGSAGSFRIVTEILDALPKDYKKTIILVLHRLKHVKSGFVEALTAKSLLPISEPIDKEKIEVGKVYIAPANYHLYIEPDKTFSLSTEEPVNHSRPSIDISLQSAAFSLRDQVLGIMLSGANKDGAAGLRKIKQYGGITIVQDPEESMVRTMPDAAINATKTENILTSQKIIEYILNLHNV
jgi:two-component system chemotaxis response regulator CheB